MPECARCQSVQPSAEITRRRLNGLPTCKDEGACERRLILVDRARAYKDDRLLEEIQDVRHAQKQGAAWLVILRREAERRGFAQGRNRTTSQNSHRPETSRRTTRPAGSRLG